MENKVIKFIFSGLFTIIISGVIFPAFAGNGARHPMEGAVFAKYLAPDQNNDASAKFKRYGAAFLLGAYSHLLSDQYGNFEPRMNSKEMIWFSAEGVAGALLLAPQWKKDPALLFGSLGAMFPDLEHSVKPFGKRVFPTHSGVLTHGELVNFWHGVIQNLLINGVSYYSLKHDLPRRSDGSPMIRMGWSLNRWYIPGVAGDKPLNFPGYKNNSLMRNISLAVDLHDKVSLEINWGTWMKDASIKTDHHTQTKIVIQTHLLGVSFHPWYSRYLVPYITAGAGVYIATQSEPVNRDGIAFAHYQDSNYGFHYGAGIKIPVSRGNSIIVNHLYHDIIFTKKIDGVREYSGWAGGLTLEHSL